MPETLPPANYSPQSSIEYRVRAKYTAEQKTAFAVPVKPTQPPPQTDHQYLRRVEKRRIYRTDSQPTIAEIAAKATRICTMIAANPERIQMFGANVLPPTINEKAPLPNGAVYR